MSVKAEIYTTPTCSYCVKAKNYFKQIGLPFREYDISKDEKKRDELIRKTGQMGVPVIFLKGHKIVGFDKAKIDSALNM